MEFYQILSLSLCGALLLLLFLFLFVFLRGRAKRESLMLECSFLKVNLEEEKIRSQNLAQENAKLQKDTIVASEREKNMQAKTTEFEKFSSQIFELARTRFENSNKSQMDLLLAPLKDDIKGFRKRIEEMNAEGELKRGSLEKQIDLLRDMNANLSKEASDLSKALRGENKTTGNWGELVLERLLESCGLLKDFIFYREDSHSSETGRLRPDVVVRLPEDKYFIIDSKVSLVAYEKYSSAENEALAKEALKAFKDSVKTHIKQLSGRRYEDIDALRNPDFVMMFIPIEPAFSLAIWSEPELLEQAYKNKIVLASPSTMLASLKTVETIWRNDKQEKNKLLIAEQGGRLYDKVALFLERFEKIERSIKMLERDYDDALTSLSGKGGVLRLSENLRELGAKTKSQINPKLLEKDEQE